MKGLTQKIEKELARRLKDLGFKKKNLYYYKQWDSNTYLTISFVISSFRLPGHRYISPQIGIAYMDINNLYDQLSGKERTENIYPTVSKALGYLMPQNSFKEWDFSDNSNNSSLYDDMFAAITTYGFAYITQKDKHHTIIDFYKNREKAPCQILSISYFLNGEKEKGLQVFNDFIKRISSPTTDEEIRKQHPSNETIVLRSGETKTTPENFEKMFRDLPSGGQIVIVGPGYTGNIDPEYLKFLENYKLLH